MIGVSLRDLEDAHLRRAVLSVPTAFSIGAEQVRNLQEAGRGALRHSPEFQRLRRALAADTVEGAAAIKSERDGASAVD